MHFKSIILLFLCGLGIATTAEAQRRRKTIFEQYSTVGVGLGTSSYMGELAPYRSPFNTVFKMMRWNLNGSYTRHFTPNLAARVGLTWAMVAGDDEFYNRGGKPFPSNYVRNLHFRNSMKEISVVGIYKFRDDGRNSNRRVAFSPYIFAGIAALAHNPKAKVPEVGGVTGTLYENAGNWVSLQPLGTEGQGQPGYRDPYSLVTYSIPFGLGFTWRINARWNFSVEGGFRFTGSDFLDDISDRYPDPNVLKNDLAKDMSNRTLEEVSARTGRNRTSIVARIVNPNEPSADPFANGPLTGYDVGDLRGNVQRNDAYLLSSFTVSYVIPSKIKCPPIK
jgi:hypothetical protein